MKIQLKRSNVLQGATAKEPTAEQMEYGELAVNYNSVDPTIFIKDSANQIIRIIPLPEPPDLSMIPDINNIDFQPDTLDVRYIPLNSWDNIPYLPV